MQFTQSRYKIMKKKQNVWLVTWDLKRPRWNCSTTLHTCVNPICTCCKLAVFGACQNEAEGLGFFRPLLFHSRKVTQIHFYFQSLAFLTNSVGLIVPTKLQQICAVYLTTSSGLYCVSERVRNNPIPLRTHSFVQNDLEIKGSQLQKLYVCVSFIYFTVYFFY